LNVPAEGGEEEEEEGGREEERGGGGGGMVHFLVKEALPPSLLPSFKDRH
jgi:hypothetical protein